jgi:hypothetical protein
MKSVDCNIATSSDMPKGRVSGQRYAFKEVCGIRLVHTMSDLDLWE